MIWLLWASLALGADRASCLEGLVSELAADEQGGRGHGSPGLERSASRIRAQFEALGGQVHEQQVPVIRKARAPTAALTLDGEPLFLGAAFTPLGMSGSGSFDGPLVFAGYGLGDFHGSQPEVRGAAVLVIRHEPSADGVTVRSDLRRKARLAEEAGASALIVVAIDGAGDTLPRLRLHSRRGPAALPVLQVTRAVADLMLAPSGQSLAQRVAAMDTGRGLVAGTRVAGQVQTKVEVFADANVLAVWPGSGALADQVVVVGAHYDHLGTVEKTDDGGAHGVHNGADDNASGVAAMLCALPEVVGSDRPDRRTLIAAGFAAEEVGLVGSYRYVEAPLRPLSDTFAMLNLDMVGTLDGEALAVDGVSTSPHWMARLEQAGARVGLDVAPHAVDHWRSDHVPFAAYGVPSIQLFTGLHERYHMPSDDPEHLDQAGLNAVTRFVEATLTGLLHSQEPLVPVPVHPIMVGDPRSRGASLGAWTSPAATKARPGGVVLHHVVVGGPAAEAGLFPGDRLVSIDGAAVGDATELASALDRLWPRQRVPVLVERPDGRVVLWVVLGETEAD